jgi:NAD(P)-dependent dehydrogenase (short-subunit alcohol dehydrogenase family)
VTTAVERLDSVTGLVNDAMATKEPKPFIDITSRDFDLEYDVVPRATFQLMRAVYPHLVERGGGSIVNFGSGSGTGGDRAGERMPARRKRSGACRRSPPWSTVGTGSG